MESNNQLPNKRLFVGSLPYKFTEGQLLSLFIPFGKVTAIRIIHTRWGKSRGLGYVEFEDLPSAIKAKESMHNYLVEDRTIIVDYSKPDPFDTPEGQQRHSEAQQRRQKKFRKFSHPPAYAAEAGSALPKTRTSRAKPQKPSSAVPVNKPFRRPLDGTPLRQTVFNSRNFHSRVGAKFAAKKKKK